MKKSEMSQEQLQERQTFIDTLSQVGWSGTQFNTLFEQDLWLDSEASMEYGNPKMELRLDYDCSKSSLTYYLDSKGGKSLELTIKFGKNLKAILDAITAHQDTISPANFRKKVLELLNVTPEIFIVTEDDQIVPLTR